MINSGEVTVVWSPGTAPSWGFHRYSTSGLRWLSSINSEMRYELRYWRRKKKLLQWTTIKQSDWKVKQQTFLNLGYFSYKALATSVALLNRKLKLFKATYWLTFFPSQVYLGTAMLLFCDGYIVAHSKSNQQCVALLSCNHNLVHLLWRRNS